MVFETANGAEVIIDDVLAEQILRTAWHINSNGYVVNRSGNGNRKITIRLHRLVMELSGIEIPPGKEVDHINHNRQDNRFENLRICTRSENIANRPYVSRKGYRGVNTHNNGKFYGVCECKKKRHYTRDFSTIEEAARARDELAIRLFGEFAMLNFPSINQSGG